MQPKFNFVDLKPEIIPLPSGPQDILDVDCCVLFAAPMKRGKTTILDCCLKDKHLWAGKFNWILIMSPSPWPGVKEQTGDFCKEFDLQWLDQKLKLFSKTCVEKNKDGHVLVVVDDFLTELEKCSFSTIFKVMFTRRRWKYPKLCVSYAFTAQYLMAFPKRFRACLTDLCLWSCSDSEWKLIAKDFGFKPTIEQECNIGMHFKESEHNFICIKPGSGLAFLNFKSIA
jgi:hypothetical protein